LTSISPLAGGDSVTSFLIEGRPRPQSQSDPPVTGYRQVSAGYFDVMGIRLVAGRLFADREAAPSVVVNETFVTRYFPSEDPLGKRLRFSDDLPAFTIIGVVGDVKIGGALRPDPRVETYVPYWQYTEPGTVVVLKTAGDPALLAAPLRQAVASIDRDLPVSNVETLATVVGESVDQPRFVMWLAGGFAVLALVLAAIGIYGVMAYTVSQRTPEFGVRLALGAGRTEVFRLVLADALVVTACGIAAGVAGSLVLSRSLGALQYGIRPADPATLLATSAILVTVAVVASLVPARRATRVDPMVALRME
jgi:putative ABC transport system permease protein